MDFLQKLHSNDKFDVTLQPQGQGPDGKIAVLAKVEIMEDNAQGGLNTVRKVSVMGFAKTLKGAQTAALKEAVHLLGIN